MHREVGRKFGRKGAVSSAWMRVQMMKERSIDIDGADADGHTWQGLED